MSDMEFEVGAGPMAGKTVKARESEMGSPVAFVVDRAYEILEKIVGPTCGIGPGIWADIYAADLGCYADDEEMTGKVLDQIATTYGVDREYLGTLDKMPIGLIALYTFDKKPVTS